MNITDIFIKRPVLSSVISILILTLGLRSIFSMPVRQYPDIQSSTITINTIYYGASADVIAGFITAPLEQAVSQAQGIDFLTSKSTNGSSSITANLQLNYDANKALTEISAKVNAAKGQLPSDAQDPQISKGTSQGIAAMMIAFSSDDVAANSISDYLARVAVPKLQTLPGIQSVQIMGERKFSLRAWLDPQKMQAYGLTASDINSSLASNNFISTLGKAKGQMVQVDLSAGTDLTTLEEFRNLVVKSKGDSLVRLQDVANVTLGNENYDFNLSFDNKKAVFLGINTAADANLLDAIAGVRKAFPALQSELPAGIQGLIVYDSTKYVNSSIDEVVKTLFEALLIVTIVIYLFLGNFRAVLIPTIAIPLSLIGGFFIMLILGYSINLLTLLALVLAIGLVVDDAIIIVENVDRHIKEGKSPMQSAIIGAKELTGPIISMSIVLIAIYIPVGFQSGITGQLFTEFAFTLAGAVGISGIVALTLSPMMCSRLLTADEGKFQHRINEGFEKLLNIYEKYLKQVLAVWKVLVVFGFLIIVLLFVFFKFAKSELAPQEDQGFAMVFASASPNATTTQMNLWSDEVNKTFSTIAERDHHIVIQGFTGSNSIFGGLVAKEWSKRTRSTAEIITDVQNKLKEISGINASVFQPPVLPGGGGGLPFQFVIKSTESFNNLYDVANTILEKARASGKFYFIDLDLKLDKPQVTVKIDREKAATLGLSMRDIGTPLSAMLSGGSVNNFNIDGKAYKVIPQVESIHRLNPEQIGDYYIRTNKGKLIPASTVVSFETKAIPQSLNRFQQLNSATISGVMGVSMSEALTLMNDIAAENLPEGYYVDYNGQTRQSVQESSTFAQTMAFAILIIFLVLAAQFESFRDPIIIMVSVPMAIFGAMIFIFEGVATLNIYTQVGLLTLVGLIAKHGILIVEFANEQQKLGLSKYDAIINAAKIRLRPILMTTAAMVLGVLPLVLASGAGAVGRHNMGLIIATGIAIGTVFTIFMVPAMYMWLANEHKSERVLAETD